MQKIVFLRHYFIALRSRSKVGVKGKGRGQGQSSRSKVGVKVMGQSRSQISGPQRLILAARLCQVQQSVIATITSLR